MTFLREQALELGVTAFYFEAYIAGKAMYSPITQWWRGVYTLCQELRIVMVADESLLGCDSLSCCFGAVSFVANTIFPPMQMVRDREPMVVQEIGIPVRAALHRCVQDCDAWDSLEPALATKFSWRAEMLSRFHHSRSQKKRANPHARTLAYGPLIGTKILKILTRSNSFCDQPDEMAVEGTFQQSHSQ
jgi:hypothetical protein